ncbi:uncharacterized protein LOC128851701 [Cuculus canorus]|uniref:uncharacterized protein LOC128851701 n=1 Tax=Cuculus canorus TaxID=55661 RepID=UPI0023AAD9D3|nr:uncharacterized protein LOC128851701 [Cuculus canorus]
MAPLLPARPLPAVDGAAPGSLSGSRGTPAAGLCVAGAGTGSGSGPFGAFGAVSVLCSGLSLKRALVNRAPACRCYERGSTARGFVWEELRPPCENLKLRLLLCRILTVPVSKASLCGALRTERRQSRGTWKFAPSLPVPVTERSEYEKRQCWKNCRRRGYELKAASGSGAEAKRVPRFKALPLPSFDRLRAPEKVETHARPEPFRLRVDERRALATVRSCKQQMGGEGFDGARKGRRVEKLIPSRWRCRELSVLRKETKLFSARVLETRLMGTESQSDGGESGGKRKKLLLRGDERRMVSGFEALPSSDRVKLPEEVRSPTQPELFLLRVDERDAAALQS